jgi:hypothetical protein
MGPRLAARGGIIPVDGQVSPFRSYTVDVGYGYLIGRGLGRGGGVIVTLGAPMLFL